MKKLIFVLLFLILCGCANSDDVSNQLDKVFSVEYSSNYRANNYTNYIEYYLPSDVYETGADDVSYTFVTNDCNFIMNINIARIVNKNYYQNIELSDEGFFDQNKLVYSHSGEYSNLDGVPVSFIFEAFEYDNKYILYLTSDEINLCGTCPKKDIGLLASKMMQMASNCDVDNSRVVDDYSSKDVIDYEKSSVNLFEYVFPTEGRVDDMMINQSETVSE